MRRWKLIAALFSACVGALVACGPSSDELCEFSGTCASATDGDGGDAGLLDHTNGDSDASTSEGGEDVLPDNAPPGCDPGKDPKDSLPCVDDTYGLFVDGTKGADSNDGTK